MGGSRGDLYILVQIDQHPLFEREGTTVICTVPVTVSQAALGNVIEVPTLFGVEEIKIPAGAKTGTQVVLRGKGMPDVRGYRQGDQIVVINVEVPQKLSRRQRELLEELERESDSKSYPNCEEFKNKVKQRRQNR